MTRRYCVCMGCPNNRRDVPRNVTVHKFPDDIKIAEKWIKFVLHRRPHFDAKSIQSKGWFGLCDLHFADDCVDPRVKLKIASGVFPNMRSKLVPCAVPTIYPDVSGDSDLSKVRRDAVINKLNKTRIKQKLITEMKALQNQLNSDNSTVRVKKEIDVPCLPKDGVSCSSELLVVDTNELPPWSFTLPYTMSGTTRITAQTTDQPSRRYCLQEVPQEQLVVPQSVKSDPLFPDAPDVGKDCNNSPITVTPPLVTEENQVYCKNPLPAGCTNASMSVEERHDSTSHSAAGVCDQTVDIKLESYASSGPIISSNLFLDSITSKQSVGQFAKGVTNPYLNAKANETFGVTCKNHSLDTTLSGSEVVPVCGCKASDGKIIDVQVCGSASCESRRMETIGIGETSEISHTVHSSVGTFSNSVVVKSEHSDLEVSSRKQGNDFTESDVSQHRIPVEESVYHPEVPNTHGTARLGLLEAWSPGVKQSGCQAIVDIQSGIWCKAECPAAASSKTIKISKLGRNRNLFNNGWMFTGNGKIAEENEDNIPLLLNVETDKQFNHSLDRRGQLSQDSHRHVTVSGNVEEVVWKNDMLAVTRDLENERQQGEGQIVEKNCEEEKVDKECENERSSAEGGDVDSSSEFEDNTEEDPDFNVDSSSDFEDNTEEDPDFKLDESGNSSCEEDCKSRVRFRSGKVCNEKQKMVHLNDLCRSLVQKQVADLIKVIEPPKSLDVKDCSKKECKMCWDPTAWHDHYECKACHVQSYNIQSVKRHVLMLEIYNPRCCAICGEECRNNYALGRHYFFKHKTKGRVFKCTYTGCNYSSNLKSTISRHEAKVHRNEEQVACTWEGCNKVFKSAYSLRIHTRIHTNSKPIVCYMCGFSCRQKASLNWHMKTKHPEEPFSSKN